MRGCFLAQPASCDLRGFASPEHFPSTISVGLGCHFLSLGGWKPSVSGMSAKREKKELGSKPLWRVVLALAQGLISTKPGFSALTWQNSMIFLDHLLWGGCEMHSGLLPAVEPRPWCVSLRSRRLSLCGSVVSLLFLPPRENPKIPLQLLRHGASHEEAALHLEKTGAVLIFHR